ncbi:unnamed protein product [Closterium sp. Naga37s-1]|nr:unnamed protein product [Closterium sp. Naga37s-1]
MFHDPCSMTHVPCPMFHAPCSMPHVPCPMFHAPCSMPHVPCPMFHAPCSMPHVPCPMFHAPCSMPHVPCPMFHAPWSVEKRRRELQDEMSHLAAEIGRLFLAASRRRRVAAEDLGERVEGVLRGLEMGAARFRAVVSWGKAMRKRKGREEEEEDDEEEEGEEEEESGQQKQHGTEILVEEGLIRVEGAESVGERSDVLYRYSSTGMDRVGGMSTRVGGMSVMCITHLPHADTHMSVSAGGRRERTRCKQINGVDGRMHLVPSLLPSCLPTPLPHPPATPPCHTPLPHPPATPPCHTPLPHPPATPPATPPCHTPLPHPPATPPCPQVICITHLPQVAVYADAHIVVSKHMDGVDGRMRTTAAPLLPLHSPCPTPPFPQVICITHLPQVAVHADAHISVSKQIGGADGRMRMCTTAVPFPPFIFCLPHHTLLPPDGRMRTTAARLTTLEERVRLGRGTGEARREELVRLGRGTGEARREERASEVAQMLGLGLPSALELFKAKGGMERAVNTVNTERHLKAVQRDA